MSDFSYTQRCPYCRSRFAPDDGGCPCGLGPNDELMEDENLEQENGNEIDV